MLDLVGWVGAGAKFEMFAQGSKIETGRNHTPGSRLMTTSVSARVCPVGTSTRLGEGGAMGLTQGADVG